jgi:hypothetical protein
MAMRRYKVSVYQDVSTRYASDLNDQEFALLAPHVAQKNQRPKHSASLSSTATLERGVCTMRALRRVDLRIDLQHSIAKFLGWRCGLQATQLHRTQTSVRLLYHLIARWFP